MTKKPDQGFINVLNKFSLKTYDSTYNKWYYKDRWILSYYYRDKTFAFMDKILICKDDFKFASLNFARHYTPEELSDEISNLLQQLKQKQNNFKKQQILYDFER